MMRMNLSSTFWSRVKPYVAVIFLRFGAAGYTLITKHALNQGLNNYSFVVYRQTVAFLIFAPFALVLERKVRPKMTTLIFAQILVLATLEVITQNLFCLGIKYSSATFATALINVIPALTFILAWIFRLEKVKIRNIGSQAKIIGTMVTFGGVMVMTLVKGPIIPTPWNDSTAHTANSNRTTVSTNDRIKGALMIGVACICWAFFIILQAITEKSYPAELSSTTLICSMGGVIGFVLAMIMEWGNSSIWSIHFDSKLLAIVYTAIICSGVTYYLQALVMKTKGPVFVTAFNPLSLVVVAVLSSFFFSEILPLGSLIGAIGIVTGLYLVLWGKSREKKHLSPVVLPIEAAQSSTTEQITAAKEDRVLDCSDANINVSGVRAKEESV